MTPKELDELKWIMAQIRERMENGFFGALDVKMENGRIVHLDVREGLKPPK